MVAKLKDGFDVRVVQLGECERLLAESLACTLISQHAGKKNFESDVAVELLIVGTVNNTHATGTNLLNDAIVAKYLADELEGGGHRRGEC